MVRARRGRRPPARQISAPPSSPGVDPRRWVTTLCAAVVALWCVGAVGGWIYDDFIVILGRPAPRTALDLELTLRRAHWNGLPYYRPLSGLLLGAARAVLGDDPVALRAMNAAMMGLVAWTAWTLLRARALALPAGAALLGAAFVAAHPAAAECVFIASAGAESLAYLPCVLGAVAAWCRPGLAPRALALALMAASLLFKEQGVVTPALFVLADLTGVAEDAPGRSPRRWLARYAPVLALLVGWFALRAEMITAAGPMRLGVTRVPSRVPLSFAYTLQTLLAPSPSFAYEPEYALPRELPRTLLALAVAAAIGRFALQHVAAERRAALRFGLGWCALAVLPTANVLTQETHFAERYALPAAPGVAVILGATLGAVWDEPERRRRALHAAAAALVYMALTVALRAEAFRDNVTFLRRWEQSDPSPHRALAALGEDALRGGRVRDAVELWERAVRIDPIRARHLHRHLGMARERLGELDDAEREYRLAVRADRRDDAARALLERLRARRAR